MREVLRVDAQPFLSPAYVLAEVEQLGDHTYELQCRSIKLPTAAATASNSR